MKTVLKDTPILEITLRKYEKPYHVSDRDMVKKICLSLGLLQPGDSRDIIVDILFALLREKCKKTKRRLLSSEEIRESVVRMRKKRKLPLHGVASSNVRRQLKRLRNLYLVEKVKSGYRITEYLSLAELFEEKIQKFMLDTILSRVKEYCSEVEKQFKEEKLR